MLELQGISKQYRKDNKNIDVLRLVNLHVEHGEFIAVQGASGCGKTTLLLIAGGLLNPNEGRIIFNHEDVYEKRTEERAALRAQNFGFVFQQYHLIPYLTVLENVLLPEIAISFNNSGSRAMELIEKFGLLNRKSHRPGELSAGEKQRTALARAMLHSPKILFADEITGNLDEENSSIVINALKDFTHGSRAVLFVTHDVNTAKSADRMVNLKNGQLK